MFIDALDQSSVSTTMLIDDGAHTYCVSNNFFSDSDSEPPPQGQKLADDGRGRIRWLSPYLLVLSHTGGRAEAYDKTWIFKIVEGKLTRMGTVGGDAEMASTGRFQSLYNKASVWQGEEFDCEACRPQVRLVIEDKDGALAANPEATWEINQKEWQDNEKFVASQIQAGLPKDPDAQDLWRMQTLGALIENAVVAKYCRHDTEVQRLTALAKANLDQASLDELNNSLRNLVPLELPDRWDAVSSE